MSHSPLVRIAPSPTGLLHVGNVRTALINFLFAKKHGGRFMLRLDDTDQARSRPEYAAAIEEDLSWLGMKWDLFAKQSDRLSRYAAAAEQLKQQGMLYPCFESEIELQLKRKSQLASGKPPLYDRGALKLSASEIAAKLSAGEKPHWRFKLRHQPIIWSDLVQGEKRFEGANLSDPVLIREDGVPLYTFCSVVDDADFSITHIIRGEDHVANTAVQLEIFAALQAPAPIFAHLPLLTGAAGEELSKRLGTLSIADLRQNMHLEAPAIVSYLAHLGTAHAPTAEQTMPDLISGFAMEKLGRAPPKFDLEDLRRHNAKTLHHMPFAAAAPRLAALQLNNLDETAWLALRSALQVFPDIKEWWQCVEETPHAKSSEAPTEADRLVCAAAARTLPQTLLADDFAPWIKAIQAETQMKGPSLYMPLRLALTGRTDGPELKALLPLLGRERVLARLQSRAA